MGEHSIVEIADALASGLSISDITFIPGTVYKTRDPERIYDAIRLPDYEQVKSDSRSYAESFGIFEIGHTVCGLRENGECDEQNKLGCVFFSKSESEEALFLRARDAAAELCADILHKECEFVSAEADFDFEHPVNSFDIVVDGEKIGYLSVAHPVVLENIDKKCAVAFFEIFTEKFASIKAGAVKYSEPSKFPAIDIDITFAAKIGDIVFSELLKAAKAAAGEILAGVTLKDTYEDGDTSTVTLRFSFISKERTLTKQELAPATEAIAAALAELSMIVR
jgi:phenylalanyl-tRNA synthetase beta chain